jgi:hypothetical protein
MVPDSFARLLAACAPCFRGPTYRTFCYLVAGWVHCLGRHTVTGAVLAAGAVGWGHVAVFHRFFSRARWEPDALGAVLFRLAVGWLPADLPLVVLLDDTLARKHGKAIALGAMHHDPLLSRARKVFSYGHVWVVLALWVPLPFGPGGEPKGIALPVLFRLFVGSQRGTRADAPSRSTSGPRYRAASAAFPGPDQRPTKSALARDAIAVAARWAAAVAPGRTVYVVGDTAYANRLVLEDRPANVQVVGRLRPDAALWAPPPPPQPGQRGRPRTRGARLPTPQAQAAARRHWHRLRLTLYGRPVRPRVFTGTALWYAVLRTPVRYVLVRDPAGRRRDEAFFCTDRTLGAAAVLELYARRWCLEVAFFELKQHLGFDQPQNQTVPAVRRTAPFAGLVHALVLLWAAQRVRAGAAPGWPVRPWYPRKAALAFPDLLAALRRARPARARPPFFAAGCPPRRRQKPHPPRRSIARTAA